MNYICPECGLSTAKLISVDPEQKIRVSLVDLTTVNVVPEKTTYNCRNCGTVISRQKPIAAN